MIAFLLCSEKKCTHHFAWGNNIGVVKYNVHVVTSLMYSECGKPLINFLWPDGHYTDICIISFHGNIFTILWYHVLNTITVFIINIFIIVIIW